MGFWIQRVGFFWSSRPIEVWGLPPDRFETPTSTSKTAKLRCVVPKISGRTLEHRDRCPQSLNMTERCLSKSPTPLQPTLCWTNLVGLNLAYPVRERNAFDRAEGNTGSIRSVNILLIWLWQTMLPATAIALSDIFLFQPGWIVVNSCITWRMRSSCSGDYNESAIIKARTHQINLLQWHEDMKFMTHPPIRTQLHPCTSGTQWISMVLHPKGEPPGARETARTAAWLRVTTHYSWPPTTHPVNASAPHCLGLFSPFSRWELTSSSSPLPLSAYFSLTSAPCDFSVCRRTTYTWKPTTCIRGTEVAGVNDGSWPLRRSGLWL